MRTLRMLNQRNYTMKIVTVVALAVLVLWSICSIKANATERAENNKNEYQMQERQFKIEIIECLEKMGYENCGITITKVMDADGSREYTVKIHHQYLDANNTEKVNKVCKTLNALEVEKENMTVNYTIF